MSRLGFKASMRLRELANRPKLNNSEANTLHATADLLDEAIMEVRNKHGDLALAPGLECQCHFCKLEPALYEKEESR